MYDEYAECCLWIHDGRVCDRCITNAFSAEEADWYLQCRSQINQGDPNPGAVTLFEKLSAVLRELGVIN